MQTNLFDTIDFQKPEQREIAEGVVLLSGWASADEANILSALDDVLAIAPFRNMKTPGGHLMKVAMTNCGEWGWISDAKGYRYTKDDPISGQPWPRMPEAFRLLAQTAAAAAGFEGFEPDACLVNCYVPGIKLSLHQDKDEADFSHPIVSVSLGLPALFLLGGATRADPVEKLGLQHSDVLVWGGSARLRFHGVNTIKKGEHVTLGARRINLTFRKAH